MLYTKYFTYQLLTEISTHSRLNSNIKLDVEKRSSLFQSDFLKVSNYKRGNIHIITNMTVQCVVLQGFEFALQLGFSQLLRFLQQRASHFTALIYITKNVSFDHYIISVWCDFLQRSFMFMVYRYKTLRTTLTFPTTEPFRYSDTGDSFVVLKCTARYPTCGKAN